MTRADETNGHQVAPSWDDRAELVVIGGMLESAAARDQASVLTSADFYRPAHQTIHAGLVRLMRARRPIDPVTVLDELARTRQLRAGQIDGPYLHTAIAACRHPGDITEHVDIVRRHAQRRAILTQLTALTQLAEHDLADPDLITRMSATVTQLAGVVEGITTTQRRKLHLMPASAVPIKRVRWLWDTTPFGEPPTSHGRIPLNALTIGAGAPGVGKSQFGIWLAARVTLGELPGELAGQPRGVIYAATEDSWSHTIAPRLVAAGANLDFVYRVDVIDDGAPTARLTLPVDTDQLGRICEAQGIALTVADPLLSLIDGTVNDYRATEVRAALEPLVKAAERYDFSIFGLAHFTKQGGADPLTRLAGSGAFGQLIRCLIAFARNDDDGTFVMSLEKNNLGRDQLPGHAYRIVPVSVDTPDDGTAYVSRFELGELTDQTVSKVMRDASSVTAADRAETSESVIWLREYLITAGGSAATRDIKRAAAKESISRSALYRAKDRLHLVSASEGFGADKTAHWQLPPD